MSSFFVFASCCFWHHCQRKSSRFGRIDVSMLARRFAPLAGAERTSRIYEHQPGPQSSLRRDIGGLGELDRDVDLAGEARVEILRPHDHRLDAELRELLLDGGALDGRRGLAVDLRDD